MPVKYLPKSYFLQDLPLFHSLPFHQIWQWSWIFLLLFSMKAIPRKNLWALDGKTRICTIPTNPISWKGLRTCCKLLEHTLQFTVTKKWAVPQCSSTTPSEERPSLAHAVWAAEETWSQLAGDVNGQYGSFAFLSGCRWTLQHQGQNSVCAPSKIPILGGRLPPYLPQCNSAHVGAKAAVFGGGI